MTSIKRTLPGLRFVNDGAQLVTMKPDKRYTFLRETQDGKRVYITFSK